MCNDYDRDQDRSLTDDSVPAEISETAVTVRITRPASDTIPNRIEEPSDVDLDEVIRGYQAAEAAEAETADEPNTDFEKEQVTLTGAQLDEPPTLNTKGRGAWLAFDEELREGAADDE
jgi:hypothetical protein